MKKTSLTLALLMALFTVSAQQNRFKQSIEIETSNLILRGTLDTKYLISEKIYLSNWTTYSLGDKENSSLAPYMVCQTLLNKKVNNSLTLSVGHEYLENIRFNQFFHFAKFKVRYEIFR